MLLLNRLCPGEMEALMAEEHTFPFSYIARSTPVIRDAVAMLTQKLAAIVSGIRDKCVGGLLGTSELDDCLGDAKLVEQACTMIEDMEGPGCRLVMAAVTDLRTAADKALRGPDRIVICDDSDADSDADSVCSLCIIEDDGTETPVHPTKRQRT